jgi:nucleotide-binding universal stress UspA family protein
MTAHQPLIVVGHDGSRSAATAVRWALEHAAAVGGRVRVVRGWSMRRPPRLEHRSVGYVPPIEDFEAAVAADLRADCTGVAGGEPAVEVEYVAFRGPASNGLLEAARDADLVVVGARGLGGFRGLALGSVSDQVVRHAPCPVVVVRDAGTTQTERSLPAD